MFDRQSIPDDFLDAIKKCSDLFLQLQENVIENNLHYFHEPLNPGDQKDLTEIQRQVAEHYLQKYKVCFHAIHHLLISPKLQCCGTESGPMVNFLPHPDQT